MGGSKRQKSNERHFVIIHLFRNLITLPTDVSKNVIYRYVAFTHSNTQKELSIRRAGPYANSDTTLPSPTRTSFAAGSELVRVRVDLETRNVVVSTLVLAQKHMNHFH